ncbi:MAG: zinc-dependent metalloprotease [Acidobacteria bacterium]|nr:zinc-dependent metalloprotease [Acidobacteriota bacterium]
MHDFTRLLMLLAVSVCALAQDPPAPPQESTPPASGGPGGGPGAGMRVGDPEPRPYDRVITKEAKSQPGIFTVHRVRNRYYYEIPVAEIGKDFLWVTQIARTTIGVGYGGQALGRHVVRWEKRDNRMLLRGVSFEVVADPREPIARAVEAANTNSILMSFNVEAYGKDNAPVIDVTRLFTSDVPEFSARTRLRARALDASRTFLDRVTAFPTNIEVEATHTYTASSDGSGGPPAPAPTQSFFGNGMRGTSASVVMHFSMVKLPEKPMMPRVYDSRVGYFSVQQTDFGRDEPKAATRRYITRWRLEKKDPSAEISEPVKPIVYYIDPATPPKYVEYVRKGIEDWQPAFEAAGFRRAIIARDAPKDDPSWSPEDARYSVVRWLPSNIENASGPHINDPRTGEIIESDIQMYHNVLQLVQDWYFTQVSPLDERARKLPLPAELQGELVRYVVAHEVGHTLGFQHNMKASATYPLEKIRNREWVSKMGHTPTLMDYSRFNYVAQPEDKIAAADLIPKIGPYDLWATMWGYKPIAGARTPDEEKKTLDGWAREQDAKAHLRFSTADTNGSDPGENTEAVGDADAVQATALGVRNIERIMGFLLDAGTREGEDWRDLDRLYGRVLGQWAREMGHVVQLVGGFDSQQRHGGQKGVRFTPVARERQAAAMKFLNEKALAAPAMFIKPEILRRIEPAGIGGRLESAQLTIVRNLLASSRLERLVEQEALDGAGSYRPAEFLTDLRRGVWRETGEAAVRTVVFRRNLQRGYLDIVAERLNGPARARDDQRALLRAQLKTLAGELAAAMPKAADAATRAHLDDSRDLISKILDPKIQWAAQGSATAGAPARRGLDGEMCWHDYGIYGASGQPE